MNLRKLLLLFTLIAVVYTAQAQRKGYWQQQVDYQMYIDVDEKNFQYDGRMQLQYQNNSGEKLPKVYFHLYFNAFQPGSMMDERLSSIVDPDRRMVNNVGTKDKPNWRSRIAELGPTNMGFQRKKRITNNGQEVAFKVDGDIVEVVLKEDIDAGARAQVAMDVTALAPGPLSLS